MAILCFCLYSIVRLSLLAILVDRYVYNMNPTTFAKDEKREIINLFQEILYIDDSRQFLANAINIYANSIFQALEKCDTSKIKIYEI